MIKLNYLSLRSLSYLSNDLENPGYQHNQWFNLLKSRQQAAHINSRSTVLNTPWQLTSTISPIPAVNNNELRFDIVIESIADEFCRASVDHGKTVYFAWSGGIDSTSILVSILKVASQDFLNNFVIVIDREKTLAENAYFYYQFIHERFKIQDLDTFKITPDNYNKIIVVDGEGGNQCMQGPSIQRLIYSGQQHLLNQPWRTCSDIKNLLRGCSDFYFDLIVESINCAPVSIDTGYDFLWWTGFNFKFDDVLIRKMFIYSQNLTAEQTEYFWNNSLYRFYQHPRMQMWSMNTCDLRRYYTTTATVKYFAKKYIYDFDHNDFYFSNKTEQASETNKFSRSTMYNIQNLYFAFDSDWNKYSLKDRNTRKWIGKILNLV
jgi:hypothetical protein